MRVLIENYRNLTAEHCGSGAMRNLLHHYSQLELDEAVVFGLGSGIDCLLFDTPWASPPFALFGRSITMEQDLAMALGVDYSETVEPDEQLAWEQVRQQVIAGHPTMLSGDIYYLDYRNFKVHFPGHRFVLLGFDDDKGEVYIADRTECETQVCSMDALRLSRNPPVGISTANLWGKFHGSTPRHSLADACGIALKKTLARMQGSDTSQLELLQFGAENPPSKLAVGLDGIVQLARQMQTWPTREDASAHAAYAYNIIHKFGTGGALFRNLQAGFMHWARQQRPELVSENCVQLAQQSAQQWTAVSGSMEMLVPRSDDLALWQLATQQVLAAHNTETRLYAQLAEKLA